MGFEVFVGTDSGVLRVNGAAEQIGLSGRRISAVHALHGRAGGLVVLAGTYGAGLFRSADEGRSWVPIADASGMTAPAARTIVPDPLHPGAILCGTEPARIFRSADDGQTWTELEGFRADPAHEEWFLPYSPRAGAVRNVYAPPGGRNELLASVEVGGLLRSGDGGATWAIEPIGPNDDIHQITGDPADPTLLWSSLGWAALPSRRHRQDYSGLGGVGRSRDGGRNWDILHRDYTRSTIVPSARPDLVLAGPATAVGRSGRIEVSTDGGESWQPASAGLEVPMPDMVELFVPAPDRTVYAVTSGGRLLRSEPGDWSWHPALPAHQSHRAVSVSFLES